MYMKRYLLSFVLFLFAFHNYAQTKKVYYLNQKLDSKFSKEIVLTKILEDSRCPEGVQCIWAGEIRFEVAAYQNKKLVEQLEFNYNNKTEEEIRNWFEKNLPKRNKQLKHVLILPRPKDGKQSKFSEYYIKLEY